MNKEDLILKIIDSLLQVTPEISPDEINPSQNYRDQFEVDSINFFNFILTLNKTWKLKPRKSM